MPTPGSPRPPHFPPDAARQVALATELDSGHDATAEALDAGLVSPDHAAVIVRATGQLPAVSPRNSARSWSELVAKAARFSPDQLRRIARRAIEAVEPDQKIVDAHENELIRTEEQAAREKCSLTLHDNGDGTTTGHFTIPTLAAAMFGKVIDAMTAPRRMREQGPPPTETGPSTGGTAAGSRSPSCSSTSRPTTCTPRAPPPWSSPSTTPSSPAR